MRGCGTGPGKFSGCGVQSREKRGAQQIEYNFQARWRMVVQEGEGGPFFLKECSMGPVRNNQCYAEYDLVYAWRWLLRGKLVIPVRDMSEPVGWQSQLCKSSIRQDIYSKASHYCCKTNTFLLPNDSLTDRHSWSVLEDGRGSHIAYVPLALTGVKDVNHDGKLGGGDNYIDLTINRLER